MPKSSLSNTLCGIAGEHFVAAELSRRGYVASLTLRNTRGIDIQVSNADVTRSVGVQVKAKQGKGADWMLNAKAETHDTAENLFYVFVVLHGLDHPEYYVVPKNVVADYVKKNHAEWLKTPGRKGQQHNDTPLRRFRDPKGEYLGRWDLLGLDP